MESLGLLRLFSAFFINNLDPRVRGMLPKKLLLFRGKPRIKPFLAIALRLKNATQAIFLPRQELNRLERAYPNGQGQCCRKKIGQKKGPCMHGP